MNERLARRAVQSFGTEQPKQTGQLSGTVVIEGGQTFVRFDGSEINTPCVLLMNANDGDHVAVNIENHTAYVTGNSSAPATDDTFASNQIEALDSSVSSQFDEVNGALSSITNAVVIDESAPSVSIISGSNSVVITEDEMDFRSGDETVAFISQQTLNITDADVETLHVGGFVWKQRADRSMYLLWEG